MSVTQVESGERAALEAALEDANSVLLLAPGDDRTDEVCSSLLTAAPPEDARYLCVTLDGSPDEVLEHWQRDVGELPAETGVIAVGETTRSAAAASPQGPSLLPVSVDSVADPSDLTGIAMAVSGYLDAWSEAEAPPVVCFDSITSLLFHVDRDRAYRFLHATTGRLRDMGAVAHYHLDPDAFDEATVNALSALFDAVVRVEEDGAVSVRKRR